MIRFNLLLSLCLLLLLSACEHKADQQQETIPQHQTGDLDRDFNQPTAKTRIPVEEAPAPIPVKTPEELLVESGYKGADLETGQRPTCENFKSRRGRVNNHLTIHVGSNTDVVFKLMRVSDDKCIRYVYIRSGDTFEIDHVPPGLYYSKIGYGQNWYTKTVKRKCLGKFAKNPLYSRGERMDFNIQNHGGGSYSIPSFEIMLDVTQTNGNQFNTSGIDEDEFNELTPEEKAALENR